MSDATATDTTTQNSTTPAPVAPVTPAAAAPTTTPPATATAVETPKPAAVEPVVPDKYDIKLSAETMLDPKYGERLTPLAKDLKLTNESAQKLAEHTQSEIAAHWEGERQKFEQLSRVQWVNDIKADKEIGGANFEASKTLANKALDKFSTPEFVAVLKETGYGNHPELVRIFARIGKEMSEDSQHHGGNSAAKKSDGELLYGSTATKQ